MRNQILMLFLIFIFWSLTSFAYQTGDVVFIKSQTSQSKALQEATGSDWTHVGIVVDKNVAEAAGGIKLTPVKEFIKRSKNGDYRVFRHSKYSSSMDASLKALLKKYNKPYDIYFEWSDERQYCSEFVFKAFIDLTGYKVGTLQTFKEMNLNGPAVKALIKKRYTDTGRKLDLNETIITPVSQMADPELLLIEFGNRKRTYSWD